MQCSRVTVHLTNKNKSMTGVEHISRVVEQATRILSDCDPPPNRITDHVYDQKLTCLELEYRFAGLNISEAEIKAGSILNCIEERLRGISLFLSDVCAEADEAPIGPGR
jgi:hypothetical protein